MRIVQANKFFYRRGGAERYFFDLKSLLEKAGHEVIPFSMRHPENDASPYSKYFISNIDYQKKGIKNTFRAVGRALYSLEAQRRFAALLKETKPDIVHLHNIYHQISPSIFYPAKNLNIPIVQTLHDYQLVCPNYTLYVPGRKLAKSARACFLQSITTPALLGSRIVSLFGGAAFLVHKLFEIQNKGVDAFICPSKFQKKLIVEWSRLLDTKFVHLPNPIAAPKTLSRTELGDYVLYTGRLTEEKGIRLLVKAAAKLEKIPFVIQGTGPLEEWLSDKARKIPNLILKQHTKDPKKLENTRFASRIMVLPSLWHEVYPYALLEAQAQGKPVIASCRGGIPEIIEDGKSGVLFDPTKPDSFIKAIEELWNDKDKLIAFGREGFEAVKKRNDPEKHLEKLVEIYKTLINE